MVIVAMTDGELLAHMLRGSWLLALVVVLIVALTDRGPKGPPPVEFTDLPDIQARREGTR